MADENELAAEAGIKVDDYSGRQQLTARCVIAYDDEGNYIIHGTSRDTPEEMMKAVTSMWPLSPDKEQARYFEFEFSVPKVIDLPKVRVYRAD